MKRTKRILCLLLAVMMLLTLLVGCKKKGDEGAQTQAGANGDVAGGTSAGSQQADESGNGLETDEKGYIKDQLGEKDFGGKEIKILAWQNSAYKDHNVAEEDMSTNDLNRAVYTRDKTTESRMKVKLVYQMTNGGSTYMDTYLKDAESYEVDGQVDMYASYSRSAAPLMSRGFTRDLITAPHLNFSNPWWARALVEKSTIYDRLYFASGDISPSMFGETVLVFFNKAMFDQVKGDKMNEYDAETLYEMVYEGTWTIDAMLNLAKGAGLNTDDVKDANDKYGLTLDPIYTDAFYQASGLRALDYNPDGSLKISEDYGSAKTHSLVEKLVNFFKTPDALAPTTEDANRNDGRTAFRNGNVLFHVNIASYAPVLMDAGTVEFGLLPMPKWNTDQEQYVEISGFSYTMWSISRSAVDSLEASAATLECMASESYRTVAPTLYDSMLRGQSSDSSEDYKMWETITDSIEIEGGRCFDRLFESRTWSVFRNAVMNRTTDYMSFYAESDGTLKTLADEVNTMIYELEQVYG